MNISEVRAKYPQYKDLSDEQLAKGLHQKFYSDMPYDQFATKIGLKVDAPAPEVTAGGVAAEAGKGLVRGASDTALMIPKGAAEVLPPLLRDLVKAGVDKLAAPSRSLVQAKPQNEAERFAGTTGEIVGAGAAGGGAGSLRGAALTAASG